MSVTGTRASRYQSVWNKLNLSGGWVNVFNWGKVW